MSALDDDHVIVRAFELTHAAGIPLRDRYGWRASDRTVLAVVDAVRRHPDDHEAADAIGLANALGDIELADAEYLPIDQEQERAIVKVLRPLVEERRAAASRSLR